MAVTKIKGSWWVDVCYHGVRIRRRSPLNTLAGAREHETFLRQYMGTHGSLETLDARRISEVPIFASFSERWLREYVDVNNGRSERYNKRKSLRAKLVPFFGRMQLDEISANAVERFKAHLLTQKLNPKTVNNHLTVLNRCLGTARDWDLIKAVPRIRLLKTPRPPFRFLDPINADDLIDSIDDVLLRSMVRMAVRAGLRYSELRALHWEDVDFEREQITVQRAFILKEIGPTKNFRTRFIPMTPDLVVELRALPRASKLVFPTRTKHSRQLEQLKMACTLAGIPVVGWHALRHTFASHMMAAGAPIHAVQALLGHSSIEMTMRYSHLAPDALRSAVSLLNAPRHFTTAGCQPDPVLHPKGDLLASEALPFLASR